MDLIGSTHQFSCRPDTLQSDSNRAAFWSWHSLNPEWEDPRWAHGYGHHAQQMRKRLRDGFEFLLSGDDEDLSDCNPTSNLEGSLE